MSVRDTSIEAYRKVRDNGTLLTYRERLLQAIQDDQDYSRSELEQITGIRISSVTSTVNSLIKRQLLVEGPKRPCKITGHPIHPVSRPVGTKA